VLCCVTIGLCCYYRPLVLLTVFVATIGICCYYQHLLLLSALSGPFVHRTICPCVMWFQSLPGGHSSADWMAK
jgi:hypothetical protein